MYLGYDNRDNNFAAQQLNGNITGVIWRSQGDNTPRKYDYEYDKLYRFSNANFKQRSKPSDGAWSNAQVDFTTNVVYEDGNGNIQSMKHMGVIPGVNNGVVVDDLRYSYISTGTTGLNGNKLQKVDELGTLGSNNGKLGDFADVASSQDYYYDVNGNLVKDLNKNIKNGAGDGVTYNFLNKPSKIVIEGKSTVEFSYDASGIKLSKKVTPATGAIITTYYMGDFVYQSTTTGGVESALSLQFVLHEEGRLKIITAHTLTNGIDYGLSNGTAGVTWPGGKQGVFEYFVKDYLGNTRMVLTEESQTERYTATMEQTAASVEEPLFGSTTSNELAATRVSKATYVPAWSSNGSGYVSKLTASDATKIIGPNLILKVMAGDLVNAYTDYYYPSNDATGGSANPANDVATSLINAILSNKTTDLSKAQNAGIQSSLTGNSYFQQFISSQNNGGVTDPPKAYLNVVFLDEQFKFVEADPTTQSVGTNSRQANQANTQNAHLQFEQKAPKNGWVFIYLSNESNQSVYFDNLIVNQIHSPISEENHYYPFGLKIGGISSHAYNKLDSKYDYQGDNSEEESETGWDEFDLRMYDPQIGRWTSPDPKDQFANCFTAMGDNPVNHIDRDGGWTWTAGLIGSLIGTAVGASATNWGVNAYNNHHNHKIGTWGRVGLDLIGGLLGAGIGYASFESIWTSGLNQVAANDSRNFFRNFGAFYRELFSLGYNSPEALGVDRSGNYVWPPDIWGNLDLRISVKFVRVLPYWNLWNAPKKERDPENSFFGYSDIGFIYRMWLTVYNPFIPVPFTGVWPTYLLLREILRLPKIKIYKR